MPYLPNFVNIMDYDEVFYDIEMCNQLKISIS